MTTYAGPPEPIVRTEDGEKKVKVAYVHEDPTNASETTVRTVAVGTFECQRCPSEVFAPPKNGNLQDPPECDGCTRQGPFEHKGISIETARRALHADNMWFTPSEIPDTDRDGLWGDVREYIREHWDAEADGIYHGLTAFALSTWFRPALTFVPHLMLLGKTTGGKTRLLNTLARVCYRAHVSASATPASMFRLIDAYDVSYFVSEYHGLPYDTQRELDAVVRAGQKRGEYVDRAEQTASGYEPDTFDPFSHIAIATQFTPDDDIINRCIQVRSSPAKRDIPATLDEERATDIRNRLLTTRYKLLESDAWDAAEADAYAYLEDRGITGRTREKLLGLLTVAHLWDRVTDLEPFVDTVVQQDREAASDSEDAVVVEAIRDLAFEAIPDVTIGDMDTDPFAAVDIPLSDVAERYEDMTGEEKSSAWVGHVRSRLGLEKARKRDGTVINDPDLGVKLRKYCDEHNLAWERSEAHNPAPELDEEDKSRATCPECGRDRSLTHRDANGDGGRVCSECAADIRAAAKRSRAEGD